MAYADGQFSIALDDETVTAEKLLVAAGRTPNLDDLGLETVGLDPTARTLEVDERLRVQEGLWAIGDVTGKGAFTHVSMYQSAVALRDVLGSRGWLHGPGGDGLVKLVADAEVPVTTLRTMIYAYPTFHRAIEGALADLS